MLHLAVLVLGHNSDDYALSLGFQSISCKTKFGPEHASAGVTLNLDSRHFTSANPYVSLHPVSMTLASGEAPRIGKSWQTKDPDFFTFLRVENMYFWYCMKATDFLQCAVCRDEKGFGCNMFCTSVE